MKGREKEFWNRKILRWERSRYSALAALNPFAWTVQSRLRRALAELRTLIRPGDRILELGCGSGVLAAQLAKAGVPETFRYTGIDVSDVAIVVAGRRGLGGAFAFLAGDAVSDPLPPAEVVVFLGLTDWITLDQLDSLLEKARGPVGARALVFSFTEGADRMSIPAYRVYHRWIGSRGAKAQARCLSEREVRERLSAKGWSVTRVIRGSRLDPGRVVVAMREPEPRPASS